MSLPRKRTCRFFNRPSGCRNDNRCPDEHERHRQGRNEGSSSSVGRSSGQRPPRAPRGKCDFYWSTGSCKRAFECKFEHVLSPTAMCARSTSSRDEVKDASESVIMPYLSVSGLSDLAVSGGDAFRILSTSFNPQQTQGYLARFLKDEFRFATAAEMCSFAKLLSSASSLNKSWSAEQGQLFLVAIASENGRLRLSNILSYECVSSTSHHGNGVLSFQRGYLPVFQYLSSKFVIKSTLSHNVNSLYAVLHSNLERVLSHLEDCILSYVTARSFREKPSSSESSGAIIFGPIVAVFYEYLSRFKNALGTHKVLGPFVSKFGRWIEDWANDIESDNPTFGDALTSPEQQHARNLVSNHIKDRMQRVISIIDREQTEIDRSAARRTTCNTASTSQADATHLLRILQTYYEGPGEERNGGPRHDNDFVDVALINVAPTDDELTCKLVPFLPVNLSHAPHPFPKNSMQRLMDIQFRLLREELLAPLRTSVQVLLDDMLAPCFQRTQLSELKKRKGGRYNYQDRQDSVMFNVYTSISFSRIEMDSRRGLVVELQLDTPPGSARSSSAGMRAAYWGHGKRLMQGSLVALLWKRGDHVDVHLGILCTSSEKLAEAASANGDRLPVRVQFFDAIVNFKILEYMRSNAKTQDERFLVESSVMFETIRPFLESLKRTPETIPFGTYLPHPLSGSLADVQINAPAYSTIPGFSFNLECLHRREEEDSLHGLRLVTTNHTSIDEARLALAARSRLDPSQAEALISALTREVALIQGYVVKPVATSHDAADTLLPRGGECGRPPGTGKTFMGVELMRVLVENSVGPILLIAFTNHALDHMLNSIITSGITDDLVRLGGRSTDLAIKNYSIEELERASGRSYLDYRTKIEYHTMKKVEEDIMEVLRHVVGVNVPSQVLLNHVRMGYPDHAAHLEEPASWISELHQFQLSSLERTGEQTGKKRKRSPPEFSLYEFWRTGCDLKFLRDAHLKKNVHSNPAGSSNRYDRLRHTADDQFSWRSAGRSKEMTAECDSRLLPSASDDHLQFEQATNAAILTNSETFLLGHGASMFLQEPVSDRPLENLLTCDNCDVWSYSGSERIRIDGYWVAQYRESAYESHRKRFEDLVEEHSVLRQKQQESDEETRLNIMRGSKVVGCTTTGAAKLISLLEGFAPRVMIVEEAGQVLESHVLASLMDSIEHLVLIGDPLQLRPTLNNFALSVDNPRGKDLYRFDVSLMERLSSSGFPMSQLDEQRRMRPEISSLIRNILYPGLKDHDCVQRYKPVRGMDKNIFFLSHGYREHGGGDDSVSKHNPYEVFMVKDLVAYFLRQGCYSSEGSIVVLCAYLGQLARVRDTLKEDMTIILDERDQDALARHESDDNAHSTTTIDRVHVTQRVKLRSIDNYQGEEADIVILSLVRNSGSDHIASEHDIVSSCTAPRIGFLKSENRANVALSRARHGLYILGNAPDFASQSIMWSSVISQLDENGAVGDAIPIRCYRHPEDVRYISSPGDLPKLSPDGGCLRNCNERLLCGHNCPYKCHADDENHYKVFCTQPCPRLCPKGHPCLKQCAEPCGNCLYPVRDVRLPCGHTHESVPCYQMDDLSEVNCTVEVSRKLPTCEHSTQMPCFFDVQEYKCQVLCDGILPCCGKPCKAKCHACQGSPENPATTQVVPQTRHRAHKCGRPLYCQHSCRGTCAVDHECRIECEEKCRQSCAHGQCQLRCSTPCTPCQLPCTWNCAHHSCPVPCGSVCTRLPCNLRCENRLGCGHRCPSVCGENCTDQPCLVCAPRESLCAVADLIMQRPLVDLVPSRESIDELVITLPGCKHTFTVETLDGHCQLHDYYERDDQGNWRGLKSPTPGFKPPPVCPTCRCVIRSPRYSRVYKRADLDILERSVASQLTKSIRSVINDFKSIDKTKLRHDIKISCVVIPSITIDDAAEKTESRKKSRLNVLNSQWQLPVTWDAIDPRKYLHGIQTEVAQRWSTKVRKIKDIYERTFAIASARSAHVKAWESSFSSLYQQEIVSATQEPAAAPQYAAEHAMRIAKMKIGLSEPLADKRYRVEAIWLTIEMRYLLANVAQEWLTPTFLSLEDLSAFKDAWASFIAFILKTCDRDAKIALRIAEASQSRKQALHSKALMANTELETLRLDFRLYQNAISSAVTRDELIHEVQRLLQGVNLSISEENTCHHASKGTGMSDSDFSRVFLEPMDAVRNGFAELEEAIRIGAVYAPLSYEEKQHVVAGLMANHDMIYSGHFYQCANGHPFIIGDCGGATEIARCPECYELIGDSNHSLLSSNSRDSEMEDIARASGALQNPQP